MLSQFYQRHFLYNPPVIVCEWGRMRLGMLELTGLAVADSARDTGDRLTKGISCWDPFLAIPVTLCVTLETGHWAISFTLSSQVGHCEPNLLYTLPS